VSLVGTITELLLLEHVEDAWQWTPIVLMTAALLTLGWHALDRGPASLNVLRGLMVLCVVSGFLGVLLHYRGNVEFELEMYPDLSGWKLFKESMMGATPALAPGAMIQVGLVAWHGPSATPPCRQTGRHNQLRNDAMIRQRILPLVVAAAALLPFTASAQLGRQMGLIDPNVATEAQLLAVPNMNATVVKALMAKRPFMNIVELNTWLLSQGLTQAQLGESYGKMFIHVNLNVSPREEILLIPRAGARMAREFDEYKPYTGGYAQFRREIGKYVNEQEVAHLEQYTFIPIDLNTASDSAILSIPGTGPRMLREFKEYRPYPNIEKFRKEIGKYVNEKEVARLERYVIVK
jgi:DNA uptake protein ComE-like DNA-binding protein